ncbi:MAG: ABC transporter permease [Alicyclobacillus herbarius]|uniref:ABC transporter permease n=1 Tax=Alicyclobacillus herbarius TaxID=122960 RepID=UPI00040817EA|nr:ABC transporter permease [Alicyclobacillus herbarius]MCL6631880.1 ABC transporter permease [Alicyclobacillus herbarius]
MSQLPPVDNPDLSLAAEPVTTAATETIASGPQSLWGIAVRKFLQNPFAVGGSIVLLIFILASLLAPVLTPYDPAKVDMLHTSLPPGTDGHLLGTDEIGRDIFTRLLYGGRISLVVGFSVAFCTVLIGTVIGAISGYFGGWVDVILMRFVDVMNSIPLLFLNILIMALFGTGFKLLILVLSVTSWMGVARLVRGTFLQLREMQYVEAARAIGVSHWTIIARHLIRNATAPIIVNATLMVGGAILSESGLSYLGLGIQPPQTSWGLMLSNAQDYMLTNPIEALYPGLCILLVVLSVSFIGDGIRDALDPRYRVKISKRRLEEWRSRFSKSGT